MNKSSTQNQNFINSLGKFCILFITFLSFSFPLKAQIPVCNPNMNPCLAQGNALLSVVPLNGSCQFTYPDLVAFHAWTSSATCSDGTNTWTRIGVPFVTQIPPAGTGPVGSGNNATCSNSNFPVDIFAVYQFGIMTCTILKGDVFSVSDGTTPTLMLPPIVTFNVDAGCSVLPATVLAWAKTNATVLDNCTGMATLINNIVIVTTTSLVL